MRSRSTRARCGSIFGGAPTASVNLAPAALPAAERHRRLRRRAARARPRHARATLPRQAFQGTLEDQTHDPRTRKRAHHARQRARLRRRPPRTGRRAAPRPDREAGDGALVHRPRSGGEHGRTGARSRRISRSRSTSARSSRSGTAPVPLAHPAIALMLMAPGTVQAPRGQVIVGREASRASLVIAHPAVSGAARDGHARPDAGRRSGLDERNVRRRPADPAEPARPDRSQRRPRVRSRPDPRAGARADRARRGRGVVVAARAGDADAGGAGTGRVGISASSGCGPGSPGEGKATEPAGRRAVAARASTGRSSASSRSRASGRARRSRSAERPTTRSSSLTRRCLRSTRRS